MRRWARETPLNTMRLDRLLSIIIILLNEDRVTARELADRFGVTIRTIYRDLDAVQAARTVEPMTLLFKGSAWYLFGYCRLRSDFRLFHAGRMADLETLRRVFKRRTASYRDYLTQFAETANAVDIVLRFPRELRLKVEEFFSEDCVTAQGDSLIVRVNYPEDEWVYAMILGYGDTVEVLEPPNLRARIAGMAAGMNRIYQETKSKPARGMSQGNARGAGPSRPRPARPPPCVERSEQP